MLEGSRVLVTGGKGLVGTALARQLRESAACEVFDPSSAELDLCDRGATERYFQATRPDFVFHLAGYVHGSWGTC
ncbi:MAG: NAD-dependent epimerase/dehydratase family protein [Thermoflexaceae bacterium]|nr:NAD-dependent epimerase/dehydratase family protein [Thermoflexaceae bacterium]